MFILTDKFRIQNAKDFLENFDPAATPSGYERNHYLFIARPRPWDDDNSPETPEDSLYQNFRIWDEVLAFKKITQSNTVLAIPRIDWDNTGDTVYFPHDDQDPNLFYHPTSADIIAAGGDYTPGGLYVMTDEFHVFKCLSNNQFSKSVDKPTLPLSAPFTFTGTNDGYLWKYMYTLSATDILNKITDSWIPVRTLAVDNGTTQWDVQDSAIDGSIDAFIIDNPGSAYTEVRADTLTPFQLQSATNTTAVLDTLASAVDTTYVDASVHIVGGTGLGNTPRKIISYVGSTKTATLEGASWSVATPDNSSQFEIWPTVTISGDGQDALAKATVHLSGLNLGQLDKIIMLDNGSNYRYASATLVGGGGTAGEIRPIVATKGGNGSDAVGELGGFFAMISTQLSFGEGAGDFTTDNDYRKIGIIRDLHDVTDTLATDNTLMGQKRLSLDSVTGTFLPDEDVVGVLFGNPDATGNVIQYLAGNPGEGEIAFFQDPITGYATFVDSMVVTGQTSGAVGVIVASGVLDSEVTKNSGIILAFENRRPIVRDVTQKEKIIAIIEF